MPIARECLETMQDNSKANPHRTRAARGSGSFLEGCVSFATPRASADLAKDGDGGLVVVSIKPW
jgi:hypothetical protein